MSIELEESPTALAVVVLASPLITIERVKKYATAGDIYGRLTLIDRSHSDAAKNIVWKCQCSCGETSFVRTRDLTTGKTKSCGCLRRERAAETRLKHGHAKASGDSRIYMIWTKMIGRCHTPSGKDYPYYGARGITVCDRWRNSFEAFLEDMGEPEVGMSLDREDNDKGYSPENCSWKTHLEQMNNKRSNVVLVTDHGDMTIAQFARHHGLKYGTTQKQVKRGVRIIAGQNISIRN